MDRFQELLWDLGEIIEVPLHADKNHACEILLDDTLTIHLEMDSHGEDLVIGSFIAELPPGRFRENVLKESLKVNATYHEFGSLAYIEKNNILILHKNLPTDELTGQKLGDFLEMFIAEAESWRSAIVDGHAAPADYLKTHGDKPSPYSIPPKTL